MADLTGRIELHCGGFLDFAHPDPAQIQLEDVAHGLSQICRFTGQTEKFYSVAEHAVLVSTRLRDESYSVTEQWEGLHHDNAEAFVGDLNKPLKDLLEPQFKQIELRVWEAVNIAFDLGLISPQKRCVKEADNWALSLEAYLLLPSKGRNWFSWGLFDPLNHFDDVPALGLTPWQAKEAWLKRYYELGERLFDA